MCRIWPPTPDATGEDATGWGRNSTATVSQLGDGDLNTKNPWGHATVSDNNNFQLGERNVYSLFLESQEQADREAPKVAS